MFLVTGSSVGCFMYTLLRTPLAEGFPISDVLFRVHPFSVKITEVSLKLALVVEIL